jgi:ABC-type multidrug transport system permease subunit
LNREHKNILDYATPQAPSRFSWFAIFSLAFSLLSGPFGMALSGFFAKEGSKRSLLLILLPIGITLGLGFVALFRIGSSDGKLRGRGFAIAAIVVSVFWSLQLAGFFAPG